MQLKLGGRHPGPRRADSSDLAIETSLILRTVFHQPLRQTEGLVGSLLELMGLDLPVPDHSTLSRRSRTLAVASQAASGPVHLLINSTGGRPNSDTRGEVVFQRSSGFLKGGKP